MSVAAAAVIGGAAIGYLSDQQNRASQDAANRNNAGMTREQMAQNQAQFDAMAAERERALEEDMNRYGLSREDAERNFYEQARQFDDQMGTTLARDAEQSRQFTTSMDEQGRQFDVSTGIQQDQFGANLGQRQSEVGEQARQFDVGTDVQQQQFGAQHGLNQQQLAEQGRQFDASTAQRAAEAAESGRQFDVTQAREQGRYMAETGRADAASMSRRGREDQINQQITGRFDELAQANRDRLSPYTDAGTAATNEQRALMGLAGQEEQDAAMARFQESPGQKFLRERQERALLRNTAAIGGLGGGNVRTALQEQAMGRAATQFDDQFNKLGQLSGQGLQASNIRTEQGPGYTQTGQDVGIGGSGYGEQPGQGPGYQGVQGDPNLYANNGTPYDFNSEIRDRQAYQTGTTYDPSEVQNYQQQNANYMGYTPGANTPTAFSQYTPTTKAFPLPGQQPTGPKLPATNPQTGMPPLPVAGAPIEEKRAYAAVAEQQARASSGMDSGPNMDVGPTQQLTPAQQAQQAAQASGMGSGPGVSSPPAQPLGPMTLEEKRRLARSRAMGYSSAYGQTGGYQAGNIQGSNPSVSYA